MTTQYVGFKEKQPNPTRI